MLNVLKIHPVIDDAILDVRNYLVKVLNLKGYHHGYLSTAEELRKNKKIQRDIDPKMRNIIKLCIDKNIHTHSSCSGHYKGDYAMISFSYPNDTRVQKIVHYIFDNYNESIITFNNKNTLTNKQVKIYWPCDNNRVMLDIKHVIKNKINKINRNRVVDRMKKLLDRCAQKDIVVSISREGIEKGLSTGEIDIKCSQSDIINGIEKAVCNINIHYKRVPNEIYIVWDYAINDTYISGLINKIIKSIEN